MKSSRRAFGFAILAVLLLAAAVSAADISGTWVGKTDTPQGPDEVTLVLKKASAGSYTGTIADSAGMIAPGTELAGLKFADNVLSCTFKLSEGATVSLTAKLEDGKLNGSWAHEGGDTGTIVMERKDAKDAKK